MTQEMPAGRGVAEVALREVPPGRRALTVRQGEIFDFINSFRLVNQTPPTRAEIARHFGWASPNAAQDHLYLISLKGWIELVPGRSRGIRVIPIPIGGSKHV